MKTLKIVVGFLPFFAFSLLAHRLDAAWAALGATLLAAVVVVATARGGIKIPAVAQGAILLVLAIVAFTGGAPAESFLLRYGAGLCGVLLGYFLVATAPVIPFTAQIARESVPAKFWHSPTFLDTNRRISTAWGLAILISGFCNVAGAEIGTSGTDLVIRLAVSWVVPIVVFWQVHNYSDRTEAAARQQALEARTAQTGSHS